MRALPPVRLLGRDLLGPTVYCIERAGKAIYVGMSQHGLGRALCRHHRAVRDLGPADTVSAWPCASVAEARELEARLIATARPTRNVRGVCRVPGWLRPLIEDGQFELGLLRELMTRRPARAQGRTPMARDVVARRLCRG